MKAVGKPVIVASIWLGALLLWINQYGGFLQSKYGNTTLYKETMVNDSNNFPKKSVIDSPKESVVDSAGDKTMLRRNDKIDNETPKIEISKASDTTTTTAIVQNDKPPLLILHVGPRKTGTSSVQKYSRAHMKQLEQENLYYLGHYGRYYETNMHLLSSLCLFCESSEDDCGCEKRWNDLKALTDSHYEQGHNVFISDETLNRFFDKDQETFLWDHLDPIINKGWRVRIVFTYRRYFTWIPSSYVQSFHPHGKQDREKRQAWPGKAGGRLIPSFSEYTEKFTAKTTKQPDWIKTMWEKKFPGKVEVFNMHESGDYITNFFCNVVPEAGRMCKRLSNNEILDMATRTMNSSKNKDVLHWDMIATRAYMQGLVDESLSRPFVTDATEEFAMKQGLKSLTDFPLECIGKKHADKLLNLTLELESKLVPEFYASPEGAEGVRKYLSEGLKTGLLCSVDADAVLKESKWQEFFRSLKPKS